MKRLLCSASLAILALSVTAIAQSSVRLKIEAYKNGSQAAAPTLSAQEGQSATASIPGVCSISVSPQRLDSDRVAVTLEVVSGGKSMKPRLVLRGTESGTLTWNAGSDSFEVKITEAR